MLRIFRYVWFAFNLILDYANNLLDCIDPPYREQAVTFSSPLEYAFLLLQIAYKIKNPVPDKITLRDN